MAFMSGIRAMRTGALGNVTAASSGVACACRDSTFQVATAVARCFGPGLDRAAVNAERKVVQARVFSGEVTGPELARGAWVLFTAGAFFVTGEVIAKGTLIAYQPPGTKPKEH